MDVIGNAALNEVYLELRRRGGLRDTTGGTDGRINRVDCRPPPTASMTSDKSLVFHFCRANVLLELCDFCFECLDVRVDNG